MKPSTSRYLILEVTIVRIIGKVNSSHASGTAAATDGTALLANVETIDLGVPEAAGPADGKGGTKVWTPGRSVRLERIEATGRRGGLQLKNPGMEKDHSRTLGIDRNPLTPREKEILSLVAQGKRNKDISSCLGISVYTVKVHMGNILFKLGASKRKEAVRVASLRGEIASDREAA